MLCHGVQCAETLGRTRGLALEQEPRGPERISISDCEALSDGDDERRDCMSALGSEAHCTAKSEA